MCVLPPAKRERYFQPDKSVESGEREKKGTQSTVGWCAFWLIFEDAQLHLSLKKNCIQSEGLGRMFQVFIKKK